MSYMLGWLVIQNVCMDGKILLVQKCVSFGGWVLGVTLAS